MRLTPDTLDYLAGRRFSNAYRFPLGGPGRGRRRSDRLVELAAGQRVLHVGCCDHLPLIRDKMRRGLYLHANLCAAAATCLGVDTNVEGIALMREMGFADVFAPEDVPEAAFDLCLLADVIEHVGDPVSLLRSMRRYRFDTLVVATPNAFRWRNLLPSAEVINTDHRYWFTPFTLCKVLVDAGYTPQSVELCHSDFAGWRGALAARLTDFAPKYRDVLLVSAAR